MGKIGDLWVRLGLKSDDFRKGLADAGNDVEKFGGRIGGLKATAVAAWAAIGAAVAKFAKDAVALTQKWGDEWNNTMNGIKGAYQSFVRQISSGEGWDNLFSNMAEAYRVSKELSAAMDEIFERKISFQYDEAQTRYLVSEQQKIMRDSSRSDAEREAAAKEIIRLESELGERKKAIWADEARTLRDRMAVQTGLNDEEMTFLVQEYNKNREIINQSRAYLAERSRMEKQRSGGIWSGASDAMYSFNAPGEAIDKLAQLEQDTPEMIRRVADLVQKYDKGNDELVKAMADADVAVINIDTEANERSMRATATLGTLTKATRETGEAAKEAAEDYSLFWEAVADMRRQHDTDQLVDEALHPLDGVKGISQPKAEVQNGQGLAGLAEWMQGDAEAAKKFTDQINLAQIAAEDMMHAIEDGLLGAFDALADAIAGVDGADFANVMKSLLTPLADAAIKAGTIILTTGSALDALKKAFSNLFGGGPQGALIAGAALVGVGLAAKAGLSAIGSGGGASSATTAMAGSGGGYTDFGGVQTQEITVNVKGTIKGSDILISGSNQQKEWNK